mmetsp:Transcript_16214/g.29646  ORF Transcript_16214/g.29646 Transcript_16214/m.29646 type:complete len:606 (+) Transcript_16214:278-2095(+)
MQVSDVQQTKKSETDAASVQNDDTAVMQQTNAKTTLEGEEKEQIFTIAGEDAKNVREEKGTAEEHESTLSMDDDLQTISVETSVEETTESTESHTSKPKQHHVHEEEMIGIGRFKLRQSIWDTLLFILIMIVLNADTNLLAPVLTPIAREFGFVERDVNGSVIMEFDERLNQTVAKVDANMRDLKLGGDITLAFFVIGGVVTLGVGYLADTVNRRNTLAVVLVLGELSCLATFFTTGYWGLWVTRALTGIAVGGSVPLIYSIFGDLFTIEHRGKAIAAASMSVGIGAGFGQTISGPIAGEDGANWRVSFVVVSVPAFILAALLLLTVKEPKRGRMEEAYRELEDTQEQNGPSPELAYDGEITWEKFKILIKTPTVLLILAQSIPGSLPWGIFGGFFSDFLVEEKNISLSLTGTVLLLFGAGNGLGAVLAGFMVDWMFKLHKRYIPLIVGAFTAAGAIPMSVYVILPPSSMLVTAAFAIPSGFLLGFAGGTIKVMLVNVTSPETRGAAFALHTLFDDLGKGLGVFFLARLFTLFTPTEEVTARAQGIRFGFLFGWPTCGILIGLSYFFIDRDYERAQKAVREEVEHDNEELLGHGKDSESALELSV